jgi:hypothetical protein
MSRRKPVEPAIGGDTTHLREAHDRSLRLHIATIAARIIADDGLTDFLAAKKKAARHLGCAPNVSLPKNHELEAALREHMAIFQRESQPQEREISREVMGRLHQFSPHLVGPVLSGTANRFSKIELELIVEDEKAFELFLLNSNSAYELVASGSRNFQRQRRSYELNFKDMPILVKMFTSTTDRAQQASCGGKKNGYADISGVEALLLAS